MATYYIDPEAASTGTGTLTDPFQSWASVTWAAGNTYLQKAGTTFVGTITPNQSGSSGNRIVIGTYEPISGLQLSNTANKAKIDGNGGVYGINIGNSIAYVTIDNVEVFNCAQRGIAKTTLTSLPDTDASCTIKNCIVRKVFSSGVVANGISVYGANNEITNTVIYDIGVDGVFATADNLTIDGCTIYLCDTDASISTGDCIQLSNCDNFIVRNCSLDHSNSLEKQCFIAQSGTGGTLENNTVIGYAYESGGTSPIKTVYVGNSSVTITGNYIEGGQYGIWCDGSSSIIVGNVVKCANSGVVSALAIRANGITCNNNTVIGGGVGYGIDHNSTYTSVVIKNNIVAKHLRGIKTASSGATENNNIFHGCVQNHVDLSNNTKAIGSADRDFDPDLDGRYRPRQQRAWNGGDAGSGNDFYGFAFPSSSPSIGAIQCLGVYPRSTLTSYQVNGNKISIAGRGRR